MKTARQAKRRGTTRPPYARELHDIAVRALRAGRLPAELAREIGVPTTTLRAWLHAADLAAAGSRHTRTEVLRTGDQGIRATRPTARTAVVARFRSASTVRSFCPRSLDRQGRLGAHHVLEGGRCSKGARDPSTGERSGGHEQRPKPFRLPAVARPLREGRRGLAPASTRGPRRGSPSRAGHVVHQQGPCIVVASER